MNDRNRRGDSARSVIVGIEKALGQKVHIEVVGGGGGGGTRTGRFFLPHIENPVFHDEARPIDTLATFIRDDFYTVDAMFHDSTKPYTYRVHKSMKLEEGDQVIVDSPINGMTVVTIVDVHRTPRLDPKAPWRYKWVVQKIDTAKYEQRLSEDEELVTALEDLESARLRTGVLNKFADACDEATRNTFLGIVAKHSNREAEE